MKTLQDLTRRILRDSDGGNSGGGAEIPPAATAPPTGDAPPPAAPPAGDAPPATPPAADTPPPAVVAPAATENILTPDDPPPSADVPPATPPAADAPPTDSEKQITDFVAAIKVDFGMDKDGKPIQADQNALKAIAPVMLKHKIAPEAAAELIKADYEHRAQQFGQWKQKEASIVEGLVKQTKEELGADLPTFVADAKKGGSYLFGNDLWRELLSVPAFANDVRIVKAMAALGRAVQNDRGPGGNGGGSSEEKDFAEKWINSSNRRKGE